MKNKLILYAYFLILGIILSCIQAKAQYNFKFHHFDSIKIYPYAGMINNHMPLLPPPPPDSKRKALRKYKKYLKKHEQKNNIDTTWLIGYKTDLSVDKNGKFNHSIQWQDEVKLDTIQIEELDSILSGKKMGLSSSSSPAMCYYPRHAVFLYKNGKVKNNFDICFECHRTKLNGGYLNVNIHYEYLQHFFETLNIPTHQHEPKKKK